MEEFTIGRFVALKNALMASPTFEIFELQLIFFDQTIFFEVLGPPLLFSENTRGTWFFGDQNTRKILSISLNSKSDVIIFRRENWGDVEATFSKASMMKYTLEEDEKRFNDIVSRKSLFMMQFSGSFKNKLCKIQMRVNSKVGNILLDFDANPKTNLDLTYEYQENGCICRLKGERKLMEGQDFVNVMTRDLEEILKYQVSPLYHLNIDLHSENSTMEEFSIEFPCLMEETLEIGYQFLEKFKEYLISRRHNLSVEKLTIKLLLQTEIMDILPFINPDKLKIIELKNQRKQKDRLEVRDIIKLDQWKNAEELVLTDFVISVPIENLIHFSKVSGCVETITVSDLLVLKKTCLESPKEFSLECEIFDLEDLNATFGRPLVEFNEGTRIRKWFFKIPENSEEVVQLVIIMESSLLKFSRIPVSSIPQNGVVKD